MKLLYIARMSSSLGFCGIMKKPHSRTLQRDTTGYNGVQSDTTGQSNIDDIQIDIQLLTKD